MLREEKEKYSNRQKRREDAGSSGRSLLLKDTWPLLLKIDSGIVDLVELGAAEHKTNTEKQDA